MDEDAIYEVLDWLGSKRLCDVPTESDISANMVELMNVMTTKVVQALYFWWAYLVACCGCAIKIADTIKELKLVLHCLSFVSDVCLYRGVVNASIMMSTQLMRRSS